jgi:hypothetical protein
MSHTAIAEKAAITATVGFAGLAVYQLSLAAGAPFGEAAWGGTTDGQLSTGLRVGSASSIVIYAVAAALILRRAGFPVRWVSHAVARIGSWVLVVLLTFGALTNFLSQSPWERFLLAPVTLMLAGLCLIVARGATRRVTATAPANSPSTQGGKVSTSSAPVATATRGRRP